MLLTAVLLCSVPSGEVGMAEAASNSQIIRMYKTAGL